MLTVYVTVLLAFATPMLRVEGATMAQYLSGTTIGSLLQESGLLQTLSSGGPYTLFIPSDLYLARYLGRHGLSVSQLRANPEQLRDILQYHVVQGSYSPSDLYNEEQLTALNGDIIRVNKYGGRVTLQGAALQSRHTSASDGTIYYLYDLMEPANGTVADVIAGESDLSTLLAAAKAAGLVDFLSDQNPITVFAPTDAAFSALGQTVQDLLAKPDLLAQILSYHVIPGTIYTAGLHSADLHTFEEADRLHISRRYTSSFSIDNGHVVRGGEDMSATNGVVHKIDHVLIPESLKSQI